MLNELISRGFQGESYLFAYLRGEVVLIWM